MADASFVLYRYPYERGKYTLMRQTKGNPLVLKSFDELDGKSGFVFAPFYINDSHPLLLLQPNVVERHRVSANVGFHENDFQPRDIDVERRIYESVFSCFHDKLACGDFSKIVLSRCSLETAKGLIDLKELFMRACVLYPRMFIALVSMPQCGTWLMATPEILLESKEGRWHTMALAGTMEVDECSDTDELLAYRKKDKDIHEWSGKNTREQKYVSDYIKGCLEHLAVNIDITGPYTLRAGLVKHLSTDFMFDLTNGNDVGKLVKLLHPTPAVCGMPKGDTYRFIRAQEGYDREYYSGFGGPLCCDEGTHLYVTLRCVSIVGCRYKLFAGGGLLAESKKEDEWLETEAKMETMRRCLAIRRI